MGPLKVTADPANTAYTLRETLIFKRFNLQDKDKCFDVEINFIHLHIYCTVLASYWDALICLR